MTRRQKGILAAVLAFGLLGVLYDWFFGSWYPADQTRYVITSYG